MATIYQNGIQYSGSGEPLIYDDMGGATSTTGGVHGLVPAPSAGDNEKFLSGDGSWKSAGEYITKTASGNPITFTDGASAPLVKCVTQITGSQDLHGYDKPWVGGAGKNKLPLVLADIKTLNTSGTWSGDAYTISGVIFTILTDSNGNVTGVSVNGTATENITFLLTDTNGSWMTDGTTYKINGSVGGSYNTWSIWVQGHGSHQSEMSLDGDGTFTYTAGGSTSARISVDSGVSLSNQMFRPMVRLSTETDSTFTPYSNICPITAYTEGEIEVRGKNLFSYYDYPIRDGYWDGNNTFVGTNTSKDIANASGWNYILIPVDAGKTITASNMIADGGVNNAFLGSDNVNDVISTFRSVDINASRVVPTGAKYLAYCTNNIKDKYTNYPNAQIEYGTTATDYEPYTSTTHTTTYPSAIYRGSEDCVKGGVEAEKVKIQSDGTGFLIASNGILYNDSNILTGVSSVVEDLIQTITDKYGFFNIIGGTVDLVGQEGKFGLQIIGNVIRIAICDSRFTTAEDFRTYLANNPLEIAYKLATPTTSSVTPTNLPIKSLSGYNHIESSTGDMEVEYITEEFQPLVDLIESNKHVYSTAEQIVGTWVDGSSVYEKTIVSEFTNHAENYTLDLSKIDDTPILLIDISSAVCVYTEGGNTYKQIVQPASNNTNTYSVVINHGSATADTFIGYVTIRYTKATTQTRSLNLSKGEISGEKKKVDEEPIEEGKPVEEKKEEEK